MVLKLIKNYFQSPGSYDSDLQIQEAFFDSQSVPTQSTQSKDSLTNNYRANEWKAFLISKSMCPWPLANLMAFMSWPRSKPLPVLITLDPHTSQFIGLENIFHNYLKVTVILTIPK